MTHLLGSEVQGFSDLFGSARGVDDTLTAAHQASADANYRELVHLAEILPHHWSIPEDSGIYSTLLDEVKRGHFARTINILNGCEANFEHEVFGSLIDEIARMSIPVVNHLLMAKLLTCFWKALLPDNALDSAMSISRARYIEYNVSTVADQLRSMLESGVCKQPFAVKRLHMTLDIEALRKSDIHSGNPAIRIVHNFVCSPLPTQVVTREEIILGDFGLLSPLNNAALWAELSGRPVKEDDEDQAERKFIIWEHVTRVLWDEVVTSGGETPIDDDFSRELLALMF